VSATLAIAVAAPVLAVLLVLLQRERSTRTLDPRFDRELVLFALEGFDG